MATVKTTEFTTKENGYKSQIAELQKKIKEPIVQPVAELPEDVKKQIQELQDYKNEKAKQEKLGNIITMAKSSIRQDLHSSFDKFAADFSVSLEKEEKAQADALVERFQEIFKDSIGDIKPKTPIQTQKQDEEFIASLPKIKVV